MGKLTDEIMLATRVAIETSHIRLRLEVFLFVFPSQERKQKRQRQRGGTVEASKVASFATTLMPTADFFPSIKDERRGAPARDAQMQSSFSPSISQHS